MFISIFYFVVKILNFYPSAEWLSSRKMPDKWWPTVNLYLVWFPDRFDKLMLQYIVDIKVDLSRINFAVWYVKNKHKVECLFTWSLSPIRKWSRKQAGSNILWCMLVACVLRLGLWIILLKPTAISIRKWDI